DGHRLDVLQEFGATGERAATEFRGSVGRARHVDVEHPDQLDAVHRSQVARMMTPERTNADHADGKRPGHAGTPRCDDETNSRKRSTSAVTGRSVRARSRAWPRFRSELKQRR